MPAAATTPYATSAQALALINTPCLVAQAQTSPSPSGPPEAGASTAPEVSPTAGPEATPTAPPLLVPHGPGVLVPPPLPTASAATPPPLPTPTPVSTASAPPVYLTPVTPSPVPTPTVAPTSGLLRPSTPTPSPPPPSPLPAQTLGPNDYAVLGDTLTGNRNGPWDLVGHVEILYQGGILVGDRAHYDGERYIDVTGSPYLRNQSGDTTLAADSIRFDTRTQQAYLINGRGVSTQGVQHGRLHYTARNMITQRNGRTHAERASLTTCENPHGGYHIEAKTLDITPGDRAVARSAVIFLGPLAVFYIPLLVIPLRNVTPAERRATTIVPEIGYDQDEGFYIKTRIGFAPSNTYYGYYRVEAYTKVGFGIGYVATISRKDGRRVVNINYFGQENRATGGTTHNLTLTDQEKFSQAMQGTLNFSYQGNYGPLLSLPPSLSLSLGLNRNVGKDSESYTFARQSTGSQSENDNYGFTDTYKFSPQLSDATTVTYTTNSSNSDGFSSTSDTLHLDTDTHLTGKTADYDFTIDRYDSTTPNGFDKLPELMVRPHGNLFGWFHGFPTSGTFTFGEYSDPLAALATERAQGQFVFGPALAHTLLGDFNATVNVQQDVYGTGDEKAQIQQQVNLTSPIGSNISNTLSYSNQHINGLGNEPFTFDSIGGTSKALQEVIKFFNDDAYALTLQTGTAFDMQAQPVSYQLISKPFSGTTLIAGGAWTPGSGNGFDRTNFQVALPLGRTSDFQISTFVDWKNKGRLESKQIYLDKIVGDCYEVRVSYNEDLKTVNVSVDLLAFPTEAANFGIGQQTSIIPQSFATSQFY